MNNRRDDSGRKQIGLPGVRARIAPPLETDVSRWIRHALQVSGVWCARNNVGAWQTRAGRPITYGLGTGSADIICIVQGFFMALEVKRPGQKPTVQQRMWGASVERAGGLYRVVASVDEAMSAVAEARRRAPSSKG